MLPPNSEVKLTEHLLLQDDIHFAHTTFDDICTECIYCNCIYEKGPYTHKKTDVRT